MFGVFYGWIPGMVWMIQVNGFMVDARSLKSEIQEEALRKGLIPYLKFIFNVKFYCLAIVQNPRFDST